MASPNISEIITTTLRNRSGKLADNVGKNNALLMRMMKKGNVNFVDGGRTILQEIQYLENGTFKRYSGYDPINIQPSDVMTAAEYDYKQAAVGISISGLEELQNSGKEVVIDLLAARIKNGFATMRNNIAVDMYSDGTADGGKQIGGLQLLVSNTPTTGVVGGINRALWPFWRNQVYSGVSNGGGAVSTANIQLYMNKLLYACSRGADTPDLCVADNNYFGFYHSSLQAIQRITDPELGQAGFQSFRYGRMDVVLDGGYGGASPVNSMYFLNTDYMFLRPHKRRNFVQVGDDRINPNQDATVKVLGWAGNATMSAAFLQGVLIP